MFVTLIKQNIKTSTTNFHIYFPIRAIRGSIKGEKVYINSQNITWPMKDNTICVLTHNLSLFPFIEFMKQRKVFHSRNQRFISYNFEKEKYNKIRFIGANV